MSNVKKYIGSIHTTVFLQNNTFIFVLTYEIITVIDSTFAPITVELIADFRLRLRSRTFL